MSTNRGIFDSLPTEQPTRPDSPAESGHDSAARTPPASPFTAAAFHKSPFAVSDRGGDSPPAETAGATPVREANKTDFPFQVAEPSEGFGFEASSDGPSPFSIDSLRGASASTQAAVAAFGGWQEPPATVPAPQAVTVPQAFAQPASSAFASGPAVAAPAPNASAPAIGEAAVVDDFHSDSVPIRQLELRAIFSVDREMDTEEIFERSRALPGIRNLARVSSQDMATVESLRQMVSNLGFGSGGLKLYVGSVPIEFICEGDVMLAVQTDGSFAPGVRERLMLVARELDRNS